MGAEERTAQQEAAVVGTAAAGGQDGAGIARSTRRRKAFDKRVVAFVTYSVTSDEAWLQFVLLYKRMVTLAEVLGPVPGKERAIAIEALGVHAAFFHFPDLLNMVHKQLEEGWHTQRHKERVLGYLHAQKIALQY